MCEALSQFFLFIVCRVWQFAKAKYGTSTKSVAYFHDQKAKYPSAKSRGSKLPEAATTAIPGAPELFKKDKTRLLLSGDQIVADW